MVSTITWRKWKDGLVSPAGSVSSRQSATGARSPLDTLRVPRLRPQSLRKKRDKQTLVSLFWQGQKDLNPRHAVLEWMWENTTGSREKPVLPGFPRKSQRGRCWFGAAGKFRGPKRAKSN